MSPAPASAAAASAIALLRVDERGRARLGRLAGRRSASAVPARPQPLGQRLQPRLARRLRLRLPLLLVREIDVLERARDRTSRAPAPPARASASPGASISSTMKACRLTRSSQRSLASITCADRDLVQVAGLLLAVAGDERHRRAPLRQRQDRLRARLGNLRMLRGQPARRTSATCAQQVSDVAPREKLENVFAFWRETRPADQSVIQSVIRGRPASVNASPTRKDDLQPEGPSSIHCACAPMAAFGGPPPAGRGPARGAGSRRRPPRDVGELRATRIRGARWPPPRPRDPRTTGRTRDSASSPDRART